jgi:hypothetical protein
LVNAAVRISTARLSKSLDEVTSSVKSNTAESSAWGSGLVKSNVTRILVVDGNGDELALFQVVERIGPFGLFKRRRFALGSGEEVVRSGAGYVVVATGETLLPVGEAE